jgi:D-sedoheptulose 7-phosphate isomerase
VTGAGRDYGKELYPFLYAERETSGLARALAEVRASTLQKARDVTALRRATLEAHRGMLAEAAEAMAGAFLRGGKLLAFGNGGSATDAQDAVADCLAPPLIGWRPLPAIALTNDAGVVTAVTNDVGFEHVFARQVIALGSPGDVALGFTTSGNSPNVAAALREARKRGMVTVALTGSDGGAIAREAVADFCFVARLDYVPRVQEGHATVWHTLLDLVQALLAEAAAPAAAGGAA